MSDQDKKSGIPSWQKAASKDDDQHNTTESTIPSADDATIEQARRFLNDENVRDADIDKKVEFLKSKGFDEQIVQSLVAEHSKDGDSAIPSSPSVEISTPNTPAESPSQESSTTQTKVQFSTQPEPRSDAPPIITYPEFLVRPARPPPLITPSRLLNILTVSGSLWTMAYGVSRFILNPMVQSRDEARTEYYSHVSGLLSELNEKLEDIVSEVPYNNGKLLVASEPYKDFADDDSSYDDPTELFHRDVGTQTSDPPTPRTEDTLANSVSESKIDKQTRQLAAIRGHLRDLTDMANNRSENLSNLCGTIHEVTEEAQKRSGNAYEYTSYNLYSSPAFGRQEPDNEFKKCKDEIRTIKAMFLSARSFPGATR